jgi:predicted Zn-dependent protease with MMP-like domain
MGHPRLTMKEFCAIVEQVIADLPEPFHGYLENVAVDVDPRASERTLRGVGIDPDEWDQLMGLFQGKALTEQEFGEHHPNRIALYKDSIEAACRSRDEIAYEIRRTVIHELAHHFGFSEDDLEEFESTPSPYDGDRPDDEP